MGTTSKPVINIQARLGINEGGELWLPRIDVRMPRLSYPALPGQLGDITVAIDVKPPNAPERYHRLEAEELEKRWREDPPVKFYKSFRLKAILIDDYEFRDKDVLELYVRAKVMNLLYLQIMEAKRDLQDQGIIIQGQWVDWRHWAFGGDERAIPQLRKG